MEEQDSVSPLRSSSEVPPDEGKGLEFDELVRSLSADQAWLTTDEQPQPEEIDLETYRTELCKAFLLGRECGFGDACKFAHSLDELEKKPVVYLFPDKIGKGLAVEYMKFLP